MSHPLPALLPPGTSVVVLVSLLELTSQRSVRTAPTRRMRTRPGACARTRIRTAVLGDLWWQRCQAGLISAKSSLEAALLPSKKFTKFLIGFSVLVEIVFG